MTAGGLHAAKTFLYSIQPINPFINLNKRTKMKRFTVLKTLLVAVGLCAGGNAWAATETYNIQTQIVAGYSTGNTTTGQKVNFYLKGAVETTEETLVKLNSLSNSGGDSYSLGNHIYLAGWSNNYWWIRGTGYNVLYNNKTNQNQRFAIVGLSKGDKFTITLSTGSLAFHTSNVYLESDETKTNVTADAAIASCTTLTSGATYVVSDDALGEDGSINVALVTTGAAVGITKIVIETSEAETMGAPSIKATGANEGTRTITITPGVGSGGSEATATYYTLDGSEPSSSNGTSYSAPFDITETTTIKAISYLSAVAGTVATNTIEAGTTLTLANATVTHSANGQYTISSNQSSVIGNPTATIHYQVDGGVEQTTSDASVVVPVTADGSLKYWLTADGYTATSEQNATIYGPVAYAATTTLNFCISNNNNWATYGENYGSGVAINTDDTDHTYYKYYDAETSTTIGEGLLAVSQIYGNGTNWAWRVQRYYGGVAPYNNEEFVALLDLEAGQIVQISCYSAPSSTTNLTAVPAATYTGTYTYIVSNDGDAFFSLAKGNVMKTIKLCETTVSTTIGATGWTTFASEYALDLSGIEDATAYYASAVNGSSVTMTSTGATVAAGTGLMLKGTAGATVTIPVVASGSAIDGNKLVGVTAETAVDASENLYVLVSNGGTAEFQSLKDHGATIPAGKAYLNGAAGAKLRIVFDGDATGIEAVEATESVDSGVIYNLAGQRVAAPTKGIYIKNGKKILVK